MPVRKRPPPIPRYDLWPSAVRSSERLRGTLVACGPGIRGVGWPETPRIRAAALRPWSAGEHIAIRLCAAWVWGACRTPGAPLEFSTRERRRPRDPYGTERIVRQYDYRPEQLHALDDELLVTTPEQTACDLLRDTAAFTRERAVAVRLLCLRSPGGAAAVQQRIVDGNSRHRGLALQRLSALCRPCAVR